MKRERDSGEKPKRRGSAASSPSGPTQQGSSPPAPKRTVPAKAQRSGGARGAGQNASAAGRKKTAPAKPEAASRKAAPRKPDARSAPPRSPAGPHEKPAAASRPKTARSTPARTPKAPAASKSRREPPGGSGARPAQASRKGEADFTDEERIESAKYLTREQPARVFEEERFVFPETYGRNRVRLLVKDPQWLFAHWDVDPAVLSGLRSELGERTAALSHLTLKVSDPEHGGGAVIHLPEDARSWYVRADSTRRAYQAELGLTLPSGEYRLLATSNTVRTPAGSASPRRASRRARYEGPSRRLPVGPAGEWPRAEAAAAEPAPAASAKGRPAAPGPWVPQLREARPGRGGAEGGGPHDAPETKGGASDVHGPLKPGASDLHRR